MFLRSRIGRFTLSRLGVRFVYILVLFLFGVVTLMVIPTSRQGDFSGIVSHFKINFNVKVNKTQNMVENLMVRKKLEQMRRELNDSTLINEAMFPANRIGRYIWVDPNLCKSSGHINIIIIVHTAPSNLQRRQRIRDSFGNKHLFQPFQIRVAFLLGNTYNKTLGNILEKEHAQYNDTVMGDFIDDYHNLSLKGVMGYHWVSQYCPNSDIILKIDDDVLVNMFKLLYSFLPHMLGKTKSIFCNVWYNGTMPILREGKWKVESHVFSSQKRFPYDYCSGFIVLMTSDLMGPMYEASKITPFFWIDDVYLFGMLPSVVGGVTYYNYELNKNTTLRQEAAVNCTQSYGPKCPIFGTLISDDSYWKYWQLIQQVYTSSYWTANRKRIV